MITLSATPVVHSPHRRPVLFVVVGVLLAAVVAGLVAAVAVAGSPARVFDAPFVPDAENGHLESSVSLSDLDVPAIARLDPVLRTAMTDAETAAGMRFDITSGWRSAEYQQWLFDDAVRVYASEEVARQFVATPERSHHVTGNAVDVGNLDAQLWLQQHGAQWGLCQIYANERWHFEIATTPGGTCPAQLPDAAG
ncbi:M15 family metallopeptidase [Microbacterium sp. RU33B]|uniref:M15 family metallopeptidase n=1 Tax=Microbacterium sp. RU33B TaxID=1907390 RepID=UPI0009677B27|nr:M15 family metallopeptidase [Microbacterium sp. RU33B]SIT86004.1 D-alanyl-D-alanine carboxypeptidase [Microbacterium sp. RU33B]